MSIGKYFGGVWKIFASITLALFIVSVIIYGLDINVSQPETNKKTIFSHLENERSTRHYFEINDSICFVVDTERLEGNTVVGVRSYKPNHIPFCYFCGANRSTYGYEHGFYLDDPYRYGDLVYSIEPYDWDDGEFPLNSFLTFDLKTGEEGSVMSLDKIVVDATNSKYRVKEAYLLENYGLLSYYRNESCQIAFAVIFVLTAGLLLGAMIGVPIRVYKFRKAERKNNPPK